MRLFFALALPAAARAEIGRWQGGPGWRWAEPEGLHLTLAFLGEVPASHAGRLMAAGSGVAARHRTFELRPAGLGQFPETGAPRILWQGVVASPDLDALAADVRSALLSRGVAFDAKPFRPHVTLARRGPGARPALPSAPPPAWAWRVSELTLLQSEAGRYRPVAVWALG